MRKTIYSFFLAMFCIVLFSTTSSAKTPRLNKKTVSIKVTNSYTIKLKNVSAKDKKKVKWYVKKGKELVYFDAKGAEAYVLANHKAGNVTVQAKLKKKKYSCKLKISYFPINVKGDKTWDDLVKQGYIKLKGKKIYYIDYDAKGDINIPEGITEVIMGNTGEFMEPYPTKGVSSIKTPSSLKKIGSYSFANMPNLKSVSLNDGLEKIDSYAFLGSGADEITIPDSVKELETGIFYNSSVKKVTLPNGLSQIPDECFMYSEKLEEIFIPKSVTSFGKQSFTKTKWLINKRKESPLIIINNILVDGKAAVGNVVVPEGVIRIENYAFFSDVEDDYTTIAEYGPDGEIDDVALNPVGIVFPSTLKEIGEFAFENCVSLVCEIPDTVEKIGISAFNHVKMINYYGNAEDEDEDNWGAYGFNGKQLNYEDD